MHHTNPLKGILGLDHSVAPWDPWERSALNELSYQNLLGAPGGLPGGTLAFKEKGESQGGPGGPQGNLPEEKKYYHYPLGTNFLFLGVISFTLGGGFRQGFLGAPRGS